MHEHFSEDKTHVLHSVQHECSYPQDNQRQEEIWRSLWEFEGFHLIVNTLIFTI